MEKAFILLRGGGLDLPSGMEAREPPLLLSRAIRVQVHHRC
jgi:hypothetical protein